MTHFLRVALICMIGLLPFYPLTAQSAAEQRSKRLMDRVTALIDRGFVNGPAGHELKVALEQVHITPGAVADFYRLRDYTPYWLQGAQYQARVNALLLALAGADMHGLNAEKYEYSGLRAAFEALEAGQNVAAERWAAFEYALTLAYVAYARDVGWGVIEEPRQLKGVYVDTPRPDNSALLASLKGDPVPVLRALPPQSANYQTLQRRYAKLLSHQRSGKGWGKKIRASGILRPGDSGPQITTLKRRLSATGDLPEFAPTPLYDTGLVHGVKRFQRRHGLEVDGVAGPKTLQALNSPLRERLRQMAINLERMRWRNYRRAQTRIEIDLTNFQLRYFEKGQIVHAARIIIGLNQLSTPIFDDELEYIVLNPRWNVPYSIATKEILPQLKKDRDYLEKNHMVLLRDGQPLAPADVDFSRYTRKNFPFVIYQRPGPWNALGQVKFIFPNNFNIYVHDTPDRGLFNRHSRTFSHGCIRLDNPLKLADLLLRRQRADGPALVRRILGQVSDSESYLSLESPVPVHLHYDTAWVDNEGALNFRPDVYGRDPPLRALMGLD